eukprot:TRINITY_DN40741_c0_g1_i7.p1 TRINITY_DN40741_c0_g1~~TRINITY_DN40741_c0_g1_i7.p1  ORF type:complete len:669 (-),score=112.32 TRINITY_DN40741_c0_g1_i7:427-2433(-)
MQLLLGKCLRVPEGQRGKQKERLLAQHVQRLQGRGAEPDVVDFSAVCRALGNNKGAWQATLEVFFGASIASVELNGIICNVVLRSLTHSDKWKRAAKLARLSATRQIEPDVVSFNTVAGGYRSGWLWTATCETFAQMRWVSTQASIATHQGACAALQQAPHWLTQCQLLAHFMAKSKLELDIDSYNSEASLMARPDTWQHALRWLLAAVEGGVQSDVVSCNVACNAVAKASHWSESLVRLASSRSMQLELDIVTLSCVGEALKAQGVQWMKALSLPEVAACASLVVNAFMRNAVVSAHRTWQRCLLAARSMHSAAKDDYFTSCSSMRTCVEGTAWAAALSTLEGLSASSNEVDVVGFSVLLPVRFPGGGWMRNVNLLRSMQQAMISPDGVSMLTVGTLMRKSGAWEEAAAFAGSLQRTGLRVSVVEYSPTLQEGSQPMWQAVLSATSQAAGEGCGWSSDAICELVKASAEETLWCAALGATRRLEEDFAATEGEPKRKVCNALLAAYEGETNGWSQAMNELERLPGRRVEPDTVSCNSLLKGLASSGAWRCSLQLLVRMSALALQGTVRGLGATLDALCRGGQSWQAVEQLLASRREGVEVDADACSTAMSGCVEQRQWAVALQLLLLTSSCRISMLTCTSSPLFAELEQQRAATALLPPLLGFVECL